MTLTLHIILTMDLSTCQFNKLLWKQIKIYCTHNFNLVVCKQIKVYIPPAISCNLNPDWCAVTLKHHWGCVGISGRWAATTCAVAAVSAWWPPGRAPAPSPVQPSGRLLCWSWDSKGTDRTHTQSRCSFWRGSQLCTVWSCAYLQYLKVF